MYFFFFFNDTATTEIYTLSLHDALPISASLLFTAWATLTLSGEKRVLDLGRWNYPWHDLVIGAAAHLVLLAVDRKSTRLNSSHSQISYAVFCLEKKTTNTLWHVNLDRGI